MNKFFFDKEGNESKGFKLFNFSLTSIIAIWGLILSINSFNLSKEANLNREQIDTLSSVISVLKIQNTLLISQVDKLSQLLLMTKGDSLNQNQQLDYLARSIKSNVNPILIISNSTSDKNGIVISIINKGGDLYNLKFKCENGIKESAGVLDDSKSILQDDFYEITFTDVTKSKNQILMTYDDKTGIGFKQVLLLEKINDEIKAKLNEPKEIK